MSEYTFVAGMIAAGMALVCYVVAFASVRLARTGTVLASAGAGGRAAVGGGVTVVTRGPSRQLASYGTLIAWLALAFVTASLLFRTIAVGDGRLRGRRGAARW